MYDSDSKDSYTPVSVATPSIVVFVPTVVVYVSATSALTSTGNAQPTAFGSSSGPTNSLFPDQTKIGDSPTHTSTLKSIEELQRTNGMSPGAAVAIVVGAIGVMLLVLSIGSFVRTSRKSKQQSSKWESRETEDIVEKERLMVSNRDATDLDCGKSASSGTEPPQPLREGEAACAENTRGVDEAWSLSVLQAVHQVRSA